MLAKLPLIKNASNPNNAHTSTPGVLLPALSVIPLIPFKPPIRNHSGTDQMYSPIQGVDHMYSPIQGMDSTRNCPRLVSFSFIPRVCAEFTSLSRHVIHIGREQRISQLPLCDLRSK